MHRAGVVCIMLCRRQLLGAITHCFLHNYCIQASGARKKAKNSSAVQQPSGTTPSQDSTAIVSSYT